MASAFHPHPQLFKGTRTRLCLGVKICCGGALQTNQVLGQALLAKHMGNARSSPRPAPVQHSVYGHCAGLRLSASNVGSIRGQGLRAPSQTMFLYVEADGRHQRSCTPAPAPSKMLARRCATGLPETHYLLGTATADSPPSPLSCA